jgi:hypothetical protein
MHSARQFYFDSYGVTRTPSLEGPGLPTPITPTSHHSRSPSLTPSESELDLDSETDDNTLDKGWLDEMRTSVREIKVLKGKRVKGMCYYLVRILTLSCGFRGSETRKDDKWVLGYS